MKRLANFDVSRRLQSGWAQRVAQVVFGLGCTLAMIGLRSMFDVWAATAGPFALVYPTVLIATLYGHALAGGVAYLASFAYAWYYVLPTQASFTFEVPTDPSRVFINGLAVLVVLLLAETFRRAVNAAVADRDAEIARRELLRQELEHRTKNNFALAASLLELQKRRESDEKVAAALDQAIQRIHSFASAYANLAMTQGEGGMVGMASYLLEIVDRVTRGAFHDAVEVDVEVADCALPREVAVAIGLFVNEALTNSAKYAFPDGRAGQVKVRFGGDSENWTLAIGDDGVGHASGPVTAQGGVGARLLEAFAQQAQAQYEIEVGEEGRKLRLVRRPD